MDSFILKSRISPPKNYPSYIPRAHLEKKLTEIAAETPSVSLIIAPPGYGKTSLAASWVSGSDSSAWLSVGKTDQVFISFVRYLNSSLKLSFPAFGDLISPILSTPINRSPEYFSEVFAFGIETLERPVTLIIDNYQEVDDDKITAFMTGLLDNMPLNLNLVIISQEDPPFAVSKRRLNQNIHDIRQKDLAFGLEEIRNIFNSIFGIALPEEYLEKIENKTEGWPAAISLCALYLSKISTEDLSKTIDSSLASYNYIIDYFSDSIIAEIDKNVLDFIIDTVLLDSFTPSLSDYMRNSCDSASNISKIKQKHFPVLIQENNHDWFRYHTLFSEYIKSKYRNPNQSELYLRASRWYEQNKGINSTIKYAVLSGDCSRIESVIMKESENLFLTGKFEIISRLFEDLDDMLLKNPVIIRTKLWADYLSNNFEDPENFFDYIDEILEPSWAESDEIISCLKAWVLLEKGDPLSAKYAAESYSGLRDQSSFYSYMARLIYGKNLLLIGDNPTAVKILSAAAEELKESDFIFLYYAVINNLIHALLSAGNAESALKTGEAALNHNASKGIFMPEKSMVLIAMARIFMAKKEFPKAKEYTEKAFSSFHLINIRDFLFEDGKQLASEISQLSGSGIPHTASLLKADKLSKREIEIILLLSQGHSNQEISNLLFISIGTVKWHMNNIFGKLNVKNRMQVILKANQLNLI